MNGPDREGALRFALRRALYIVPALAACRMAGSFLFDRWFRWDKSWFNAAILAGALGWWFVMLLRGRKSSDRSPGVRRPVCATPWLVAAALSLLTYAGLYRQLPVLLGHVTVVFGFACLLVGLLPDERRRVSWGFIPLVLLCLPVMPTVQYVLGYPLRVLAAHLASLWLGGDVTAVGTGLEHQGRTLFVDAPCSGVAILSTALILAAAVALALRLPPWRTVLLLCLGLSAAVLTNALRTAGLLILEGYGERFADFHEVVGIVDFALCAAAVVGIGLLLRRRGRTGKNSHAPPAHGLIETGRMSRATAAVFWISCLAACAAPLATRTGEAARWDDRSAFAWPATWDGAPLVEVPLDPAVKEFIGSFPGRLAEFRLSGTDRTVLLRWTPLATRKLHPAEGCFRAAGGTITPLPALRDGCGHVWSRFCVVRRDGTERQVRQCYFAVPGALDGRPLEEVISGTASWPDAASWYWNAAIPDAGVRATLAVTVAER